MRKSISILLTLAFLACNSYAYAAINTLDNAPDWRAQIFIANQIKGIGLVDSYQEDGIDKSYVYDNALAAISSMLMGNFGLAKEIFDTLAHEVKNTNSGVPSESYNYLDTSGNGSGFAYGGNSAWLLQSLNIYQKLTGSKSYFNTQKKLADFLLSLQDPNDGGLKGDLYENWKSTEHNLMAYVALRNFAHLNHLKKYLCSAQKIRKFLKSAAVWDGIRFNRGAGDATQVVDVQSLGVLALGKTYSRALTWAEQNLSTTKPFNTVFITGFDFNGDLDTVWLEGTIQAALAFYFSGNPTKGDYYFTQACKAIQSDGSLVLATNTGSASEWWIMQPWRAIAPTSWFIFYSLKFNPFILY